ncbi:MAG TPA: type VI secretion system contractile sheath small subunit [Victivallales bacterium]|nr:type VI secretion system contractile sheath small subunit [Victivallales bacterium]
MGKPAAIDTVPKSRITIKYETEVNGQLKQKEIPFKMMIMGDLSNGSSPDRENDISKRRIREIDGGNLDETIKDMGIRLQTEVENKIDPANTPSLKIDIPIDNSKSFNPAAVAKKIPELNSLLELKEMIKDFESTMENNKTARKQFNQILSNSELYDVLKDSLTSCKSYTLPDNSDVSTTKTED